MGDLKYKKVVKFLLRVIGKITLYDSLLLLPNSLTKLAEAFNVSGKLSYNVLNNNQADLNDPVFRANLLDYNKTQLCTRL